MNEKLWYDSDDYCVAIGFVAGLMRRSNLFFDINIKDTDSSVKITNYDDVVLTFNQWLKEGSD
jgi:hypothetical protein